MGSNLEIKKGWRVTRALQTGKSSVIAWKLEETESHKLTRTSEEASIDSNCSVDGYLQMTWKNLKEHKVPIGSWTNIKKYISKVVQI